MQATASTFNITREGIAVDSRSLITEALQIGSLPSCELCLNHPKVSRLHAGLKEENGRLYIYNFSQANDTLLNGRVVPAREAEALADGDVVEIGPYSLHLQLRPEVVNVHVTQDLASRASEAGTAATKPIGISSIKQSPLAPDALEIYWQRRKREEGKLYPASLLHPQPQARLGKVRFNWLPTRDLVPSWPRAIIPWSLLVVALLTLIALLQFPEFFSLRNAGANPGMRAASDRAQALLPYRLLLYAAGGVLLTLIVGGAANAVLDVVRLRRVLVKPADPSEEASPLVSQISKEDLERLDPDAPDYPHPVIFPERCIGCHACVEACPHDVLAMVDGIAMAVDRDQCMEDTACQVECPVSPKACIVINTTTTIKPRPIPNRDMTFMTNVPGCYVIGDVSGHPLIKNAVNEGIGAVSNLVSKLDPGSSPGSLIELDVAIIGAGPAGLSAAIVAKQRGLKYVIIEQNRVLSTIASYPQGKYVFLKPESQQMYGSLAVDDDGITREELLGSWFRAIREHGLVINEDEGCKAVKKAVDGDYFIVMTEKGYQREQIIYRAHRIILAIGNRGTPMKLRLPGEEIKVTRDGRIEDKVKYKLADPEVYRGKRIIVVGAGNTAVEAAVDLVARRHHDQIMFRPAEQSNDVTLVIRSDLKNDLKFENKMQVYDCIDEGKIKVFFGASIKEISEDEVVLMNSRTMEERARMKNDYIFALIGGDRPTKFLESIGIKIG